jgi:hypothetical protein
MSCTLILIDLNETFAERMRRDSDDSVYLRIKIWTTSKCFDRDAVLFDALVPPVEVFFANELQHADEVLRATQKA